MGCGSSSTFSTGQPEKFSPPPLDGDGPWHLTVPVDDLDKATMGASIADFFLVIHDNKKADTPRLSVVSLKDGQLHPVDIMDSDLEKPLHAAKDLECLFMVPKEVAGQPKNHWYITMTSIGDAWMFKVSMYGDSWIAHHVRPFKLLPPAHAPPGDTNCEGARAFVENGSLYLEYGSRGGSNEGKQIMPWCARMPLDLQAIDDGTFVCDPAQLEVTYWPPAIDGDPLVRQCADMGQAIGLAKYGQMFAAAYDDEAHEVAFRSYIMERLPGAKPGGVENYKPLYKIPHAKIEAIMDLTREVGIFATDDEGKGAYICVLHRYSGLAWRVRVQPPEGADPRLYGVSGISPVDPSVKKSKADGSDSEGEKEEDHGDAGGLEE